LRILGRHGSGHGGLFRYQLPVLGIEAQGSAFSFAAPFCSNSIEMPSGDLMNAM
jgi:hypothetical protein